MENNFIQMAASAGHAVAYTIGSIFKHIIDCVQLYFTNDFTNMFFFFAKIGMSIGKSIVGPLSEAYTSVYTNIFVRRKNKTNYLSNQT